MSVVLFAEGARDDKTVLGETKPAAPIAFLKESGIGGVGEMGVGLRYNDGSAALWGLVMPHRVLTSYRGMRLAELVKEFEHGTLAACWHSGNRKVHPSEKRYVDEIEAKVGRAAREQILSTLPEDFEGFVERLGEKDVYVPGLELEEEVKAGVLKVTPRVQELLDRHHKEIEEAQKAERGMLIPVQDVEAYLSTMPHHRKFGDISSAFLRTFERFIDSSGAIAIYHLNILGDEVYIVAKHGNDKNIELTLAGRTFVTGEPGLTISMEYGGRNTEFQPWTPQPRSPEPGRLEKVLLRLHVKSGPAAQPTSAEIFPIGSRNYGAKVELDYEAVMFGADRPSQILVREVKDARLEQLTSEVYDHLIAQLAPAPK